MGDVDLKHLKKVYDNAMLTQKIQFGALLLAFVFLFAISPVSGSIIGYIFSALVIICFLVFMVMMFVSSSKVSNLFKALGEDLNKKDMFDMMGVMARHREAVKKARDILKREKLI